MRKQWGIKNYFSKAKRLLPSLWVFIFLCVARSASVPSVVQISFCTMRSEWEDSEDLSYLLYVSFHRPTRSFSNHRGHREHRGRQGNIKVYFSLAQRLLSSLWVLVFLCAARSASVPSVVQISFCTKRSEREDNEDLSYLLYVSFYRPTRSFSNHRGHREHRGRQGKIKVYFSLAKRLLASLWVLFLLYCASSITLEYKKIPRKKFLKSIWYLFST